MESKELIKRYIYAVTKHLPENKRQDVGQELQSLIEETLAERSQGAQPTDADTKTVLMELGRPAELAAKYDPHAKDALIGQPHFSVYLRVLKIVLLAVSLGMAIASLLQVITGFEGSVFELFGNVLSNIWQALLGAFAWVTVIFAILYQKDVKLDVEMEDMEDLPEVPEKRRQIKLGEIIASFIFTILFLILFVVVPQVNIPFSVQGTDWIPIFNPEVLIRMRWLFIAAAGAAVLNQSVRFFTRRHSLPVFLTTVIETVMQVALLFTWFTSPNVFNPDFTAVMGSFIPSFFTPANWAPLQRFPENLSAMPLLLLIIFGGVLLGSLIELIETGVKTFIGEKP
ncbi:MAG TPA: hypothetical protein PKY64_07405 [Anaerolineaceae bacterium]|nr:hypothetical protein [Anaerolineaceae bacterium]